MQNKHQITRTELGKIRIYMTPGERISGSGLLSKLQGRRAYRELIKAARHDKLLSAVAYQTHYGYSNEARIELEGIEIPNPNMTLCVELIDHKDRLETFCRHHGALLKDKVVIYKHVEKWSLHQPVSSPESSAVPV